jgi:hypothetical protein
MARFSFQFTALRECLVVSQQGLPVLADLPPLQEALLRAIAKHRVRRVLFDNRDMEAPSEEVRDAMIRWLDEQKAIEAAALLLRSDLIMVRTTMDALGKGVRRRGLTSMNEAIAWLAGGRAGRQG